MYQFSFLQFHNWGHANSLSLLIGIFVQKVFILHNFNYNQARNQTKQRPHTSTFIIDTIILPLFFQSFYLLVPKIDICINLFFWTKITKSSHWLELGKGIFQSAMTMFWSSSSTFFKLSRQTNSCQLLLLSISIVRVSIKWVYLFSNRSLSWAQLISNSFFRLNFGDSTSELAWGAVLVVIVSAILR